MASPISPNTGQSVNFHTNVNRAKTKRWVEAKSYAYDGDDWGDGDEYEDEYDEPAPQSAADRSHQAQPPVLMQNPHPNQAYPGQRYGDLSHRSPGQFANRSATNPAPIHNKGQPSFDQGDDRRVYSTNIGGFEGPYPTAQRAPFSPVDQFPQGQNNNPRMSPQRGPPPVSSLQQGRRPSSDQESFPRAPFISDGRPGPYSDPRTGPFPGQMPQPGRRSQSSGRPTPGDIYGGRDSPNRAIPSPLSAVSQGSRDGSPGKSFPPRRSSLSQQTGPPDFHQPHSSREHDVEHEQPLESPIEAKPLPFIRPADIYKRMAEEKERERRASEESSRPSIDDLESQKRLNLALAPVKERESDYGMDILPRDTLSAPNSIPPDDLTAKALVGDSTQSTQQPRILAHTTSQPTEPSSLLSDTKGSHLDPNTGNAPSARTDRVAEDSHQYSQDVSALRHNPSAGFTSVVHQAFDDSQTKVPPTPSSTSGNSILRSNSASASDISPIIEKASSDSRERPMSSSTITPTTSQNLPMQESDPLPPPIRPGFRRDSRTPSPGNSPARRPISVGTEDAPREELGILSASTPTQSKPVRDAPFPVPRAESPTKGTVRDLAGRLESRSSASSPVRDSASIVEVPRPSNQRLESFRPSLPGGWDSYNTSTGPSPAAQVTTSDQATDNLSRELGVVTDSEKDEEIPTAGPPKQREAGYDTSGKAFQALQAAGSALSGAFGTMTGVHQDDSSENENSTESSSRDSTPARERPGGLSPVQEVLSVASNAPPTPPAKDGPHEWTSSQLGYFPSPLRTNQSNETSTPMRPQMLPALSTDNSPQDTENDRLRKEIVRSLTPKSAKGGSQLRPDDEQEPVPGRSPAAASSPLRGAQDSVNTPLSEDDYDWDEPAAKETGNAKDESVFLQHENEWPTSNHLEETKEPSVESIVSTASPVSAARRPAIQQRFSWEASTESVGTMSKRTENATSPISQPQAYDTVNAITPIPQAQAYDTVESPRTIKALTDSVTPAVPLQSKPSDDRIDCRAQDRSTIIPVAESDEDLRSELPPPVAKTADEPRRSVDSEPDGEPLTMHYSLPEAAGKSSTPASASEHMQESPAQPSLPATRARDIPFREILGMNTPQERIRAYHNTRQQLAMQDSGLANWLQTTGSQYPEHHDLLNRNGRLLAQQSDAVHSHKPSPSRAKFPRLGVSLGGTGQQPHAEANDASRPSLGSPSSGKLTSQQVQEEGKKLLQSAGKIGGKAGGAAKGLFAKGKNKFRVSSGGDKALLSNPRASQPMINVDDGQHSSGTATTAPQISPVFPKVNSNDTWSLSYAPSENISRTTTVNRTPPTEEPLPEQPKYANLGPPAYPEDAINTKDGLLYPPAPSPQVSALGSTHQDDIPSRSISEVTRPDDQKQNASPTGSLLHHGVRNGVEAEAHAEKASSPPTKGPQRSRPVSLHAQDMATPGADEKTHPQVIKHTTDEPQATASSGSSYSQPPAHAQLQLKRTEIEPPIQHNGPGTESPAAPLEPQQSLLSAVSSPSPRPPTSDHDGLSPTITRQSVSPAHRDLAGEMKAPAASPPVISPSYEDATPPYSATMNTKEAEAAAERSLSAPQDRRQSLPAYQSPIRERAPPLPFQPPAIVPVADLSARRREEERRPPSRPFSFVDTNHEDILHRHTASKESQNNSGTGSSLSKELGLDKNETGEGSYSRSYSTLFSDANLGQHPALRGSVDKPLPSQNRDFAPPQRPPHPGSPLNNQRQPEQQYRIPGPYGQQFKPTKPNSTSSNVEQTPIQQPPHSAPLREREGVADAPSMTQGRHRSSDVPVIPRLATTDYSLPGVRPPRSPEPSGTTPKSRTGAARLFHPRSKSKPHLAKDDDSDLQEDHHKEDGKGDRRGSMFRPRSRQDNESTSSQFGSTKGNAGGSQSSDLVFYQRSPNMQAQGVVQNGLKKKGKDQREQKTSKKLQRAAASNSQTKTESKKKGGFLRLSGLFGKSGKDSPPPANEQQVQRAVSLQPMSSPPLPRTSAPASSVPYQQHQSTWRDQEQAHYYNHQRTDSFKGQAPPVDGYYAPANPVPSPMEHQTRYMPPRDRESFIGGRLLSDQRAAEQARHLENIAGLRSQNQAEMPYQLPQPQFVPTPQPRSAPPSAQHFDRSQIQQSRAPSQRFPPDLRIDTSGRLNANRRSQPLPGVGTMSNQDTNSRGRIPLSENPTNNIPTHSASNPQRHSPYADRTSQHSPYGYGTARGLCRDNLSHAIDLHKRSRSPRNGRRESYDSQEERTKAQDPANKLGTFSETHRSRSQRGESGEDDGQEKPWKIDLPVAGDVAPRTAAERVMGLSAGDSQRIPLSSAARNVKLVPPVELPGSKAPGGTESDEEIVMSSTAYPGQEWMPEMQGYGHWDDHN